MVSRCVSYREHDNSHMLSNDINSLLRFTFKINDKSRTVLRFSHGMRRDQLSIFTGYLLVLSAILTFLTWCVTRSIDSCVELSHYMKNSLKIHIRSIKISTDSSHTARKENNRQVSHIT